ncbi:hypothetical protein FA13DRAFT_1779374 [Coprinellus micaceus]|uniref:Uncharacterized protein n=1 Tax=Coprinellus micaceus TaxID=71717 RepID=A0A4Y7SHL0_COPMI|nr:hypothetical protein FA13DRAFT_1779374 [Coprinellus micaceus]
MARSVLGARGGEATKKEMELATPPSPATLPLAPSRAGIPVFVPTHAVGNRLDAARDAGVDPGVDAEGPVARRPARVFDVEGGRGGRRENGREGDARRGKAKVVVVVEEMMPCQIAPSRRSRADRLVEPNRTKGLDDLPRRSVLAQGSERIRPSPPPFPHPPAHIDLTIRCKILHPLSAAGRILAQSPSRNEDIRDALISRLTISDFDYNQHDQTHVDLGGEYRRMCQYWFNGGCHCPSAFTPYPLPPYPSSNYLSAVPTALLWKSLVAHATADHDTGTGGVLGDATEKIDWAFQSSVTLTFAAEFNAAMLGIQRSRWGWLIRRRTFHYALAGYRYYIYVR